MLRKFKKIIGHQLRCVIKIEWREREKKRQKRKQEVDDDQFSTRKSPVKSNINRCICCQRVNYEKLNDYNTQSAEVLLEKCNLRCKIQYMIVTLASGDLVSSGSKNHGSCLTIYRNRSRSFV